MIRAAFLTLVIAGPAQAAEFAFCWKGDNGYTLAGRMTIADERISGRDTALLTEEDVIAFTITGYHQGIRVGSWTAFETPGDTFHLRFDPEAMEFPTGGGTDDTYQAWNADGTATNCGTPGFGFNGGSNAQDVCIDGTWITASMVDRFAPFPVVEGAQPPQCYLPPTLS